MIAPKLGCSPDSLRVWCQQAEGNDGQFGGVATEQAEKLKSLEREVRELKQANEIHRKASALTLSLDFQTLLNLPGLQPQAPRRLCR